MKTIEVIVSPNGQTKLETKGFAGSQCREASKDRPGNNFTNWRGGIQYAWYEGQPSMEDLL